MFRQQAQARSPRPRPSRGGRRDERYVTTLCMHRESSVAFALAVFEMPSNIWAAICAFCGRLCETNCRLQQSSTARVRDVFSHVDATQHQHDPYRICIRCFLIPAVKEAQTLPNMTFGFGIVFALCSSSACEILVQKSERSLAKEEVSASVPVRLRPPRVVCTMPHQRGPSRRACCFDSTTGLACSHALLQHVCVPHSRV